MPSPAPVPPGSGRSNLGWKLAAEVKGWAPEGLLDTYESERHPVAAQVLENTRAQSLFLYPAADERVEALRELFTTLMAFPTSTATSPGWFRVWVSATQ
jgi:2-polyprenyl-6-methoxyphenol hydroxylase-like FAD-dependent oxidoreductase